MKKLRIAIPKGRLQQPALEVFAAAGYFVPAASEILSRRLLFQYEEIEWILVKDADLPVFVEMGAADAGIVGLDQLLEQEPAVYQPVELEFGRCEMWLIASPAAPLLSSTTRLATKYPNIARSFLTSRAPGCEVIRLQGSVELAAVLNLTPYIVDLVQTGQTVRAHGLILVERIATITPRLIVNKSSYRLLGERMRELVRRLESAEVRA